jgi:hypothetical protein
MKVDGKKAVHTRIRHQYPSPLLVPQTSSTQFKCCGSAAPFVYEKETAMRDGDNEERAPRHSAACCSCQRCQLAAVAALTRPSSSPSAAHVIFVVCCGVGGGLMCNTRHQGGTESQRGGVYDRKQKAVRNQAAARQCAPKKTEVYCFQFDESDDTDDEQQRVPRVERLIRKKTSIPVPCPTPAPLAPAPFAPPPLVSMPVPLLRPAQCPPPPPPPPCKSRWEVEVAGSGDKR